MKKRRICLLKKESDMRKVPKPDLAEVIIIVYAGIIIWLMLK